MKILITGGFGFIGGRISQSLRQTGHEVIIGTRKIQSDTLGFNVVQTDWLNCEQLESICKGIDTIIHLAGMNSYDCFLQPNVAINVNRIATSNLILAAKKQGVKNIIYFSTAHVYVSPLEGTITEKFIPQNTHPYATSHRIGEDAVLKANLETDFQGIVIRLSNGFGVPICSSANCWILLVNDLCRQAIEIGTLNLKSSGNQVRNFISMNKICNTIKAIVSKFENQKENRNIGGIYNMGGCSTMTILEMAQFIQSRCKVVLGFEPKINIPILENDEVPIKLNYVSKKIEKMLGSIEEGLELEVDQLLIYCKKTFLQKYKNL